MPHHHRFTVHWAGPGGTRPSARPPARIVATLAGALVALALTACSSHHGGADPDPSAVMSSLGTVPIPTAPADAATPIASEQKLALLAIGEPVQAQLPDADALVTALGPEELTPYTGGATPPQSTVGIITVTVKPSRGSLTLTSADLSSKDETGALITLTPVGASTATATAGTTTALKVQGAFDSGAAEVTWRHDGKVIAVWDFNIELD